MPRRIFRRGADSKVQLAFEAAPKESAIWERIYSDVSSSVSSGLSEVQNFFSSIVPSTEETKSKPRKVPKGIYGVTYQRYPIASYVNLPSVLQPFVALPFLDHILLIGRPTADKSGGLSNYRAICPKRLRREAPFIIILDE
ncbi:hypothetical protein H632_c2298p0, partial [Helicosporidium sp. ATCC 50920]